MNPPPPHVPESAPAFFEGLGELASIVGGRAVGAAAGAPAGYAIDTRRLPDRGLFFAFPGERTDGHRFLGEARRRGAWAAVVRDGAPAREVELPHVVVEDVGEALLALAAAKRERLAYPMIAITGSNGKTSTKDMVGTLLGAEKTVASTLGNYNNLLGLPLSLLAAPMEADVGVFELGMSYPGEIDRLAALLRPRHGVITNIAQAHLETLGSLEAVREAKAELIPHLPEDGVLYLNADDPSAADLAHRAGARAVRRVSTRGLLEAEVTMAVTGVDLRGVEGELVVDSARGGRQRRLDIHWPVPGRHLVYPLLFGVLLARDLGVEVGEELLESARARVHASPGRMQVREAGGAYVIDDSYNANPASMEAALAFLLEVPVDGKRYCILGDMLELGQAASVCHRAVYERVACSRDISGAWFVGPLFTEVGSWSDEGAVRRAATAEEAAAAVRERLEPGDVVLVKASRGLALDRAVELLVEPEEGA